MLFYNPLIQIISLFVNLDRIKIYIQLKTMMVYLNSAFLAPIESIVYGGVIAVALSSKTNKKIDSLHLHYCQSCPQIY